MKKRIGFVSNSSSSSFILVGIKLDGKISDEELAKTYITEEAINDFIGDNKDKFIGENKDDDWWSDLWREKAWEGNFKLDLSYVDDDYNQYLGKMLANGSDELEDGEFSVKEIIEISEQLKDLGECKVYYGTYPC